MPVGLFLPGPGPRSYPKGLNLPLTAYETAVEALGPAATWRLQDPDPGAQIPFLDDQFTGTDGTLLSAHSTDSGHSWTKHPTLADTSEIKTNRLCYTTGGAGDSVYYSSDVPSSADYTVESINSSSPMPSPGAGV